MQIPSKHVQKCSTCAKQNVAIRLQVKSLLKAAFTMIYILIVCILLVNKIIYKWPHLCIKI